MKDLAIGESVLEEWECPICGVGREVVKRTRLSEWEEVEEVIATRAVSERQDPTQMGLFEASG